MNKVHYLMIHSEAGESSDEVSEIACGLDVSYNLTPYEDQVTCGNCIKVINAMFIASLVRAGDGTGGVKMTKDKNTNQKLINELLERSKTK